MKPELAVLPLEVWADVFDSPVITRQKLAEIANNTKERAFAEKLQKILHECGKHSLSYLQISSKSVDEQINCKYQLRKRKIFERRTSLAVAPRAIQALGSIFSMPTFEDCGFPETEMPENIKTFKQLAIGHLDDKVLDFLDKTKPLFTNVFLCMFSMKSEAKNVRILFRHLLPLVASIRGICCSHVDFLFLGRHFPAILAQAREWELYGNEYIEELNPISIPAYLDWLSAPQQGVGVPKFLKTHADTETTFDIVAAVREQFLAATSPSAFAILIQSMRNRCYAPVEEFHIQNATTNEQLGVRNAIFQLPHYYMSSSGLRYVEIVRYPTGAEPTMREWLEERAFYQKKYHRANEEADRMIWIHGKTLTIGQITKKKKAVAILDQSEDESADNIEDEVDHHAHSVALVQQQPSTSKGA